MHQPLLHRRRLRHSRDRRPTHARGVGLIEVLLAVVVLSIGFLAAARMQVHGMATSQNAYALSQAKYLVLDMAERMRANRAALRDELYDALATEADTSAPDCVTTMATCSRAEIVVADKHAWSLALHPTAVGAVPLLPSSDSIEAAGSVTLDKTTGAYDVRVQWAERLEGEDAMRSVSIQVIPSDVP